MKTTLIIIISLMSFVSNAQDSIVSDHNMYDEYYSFQGTRIHDLNHLISIVGANPLALNSALRAQQFKVRSVVLLTTSIFTVGTAAGHFGDKVDNESLIWYGISALCITGGLMSYHNKNKSEQKAVNTFNEGVRTSGMGHQLDLVMSGNGLGLRFYF